MLQHRHDVILGINANHPDAAAAILVDGELVAAVEEERFRRIKHVGGFPTEAVRACVQEAGIEPAEIGWIAQNRDARAHLWEKAAYVLQRRPSFGFLRDRLANARRNQNLPDLVAAALDVPRSAIGARFVPVEHHRAHLASAFFASPFDSAVVVSVDGFGDFSSTSWASGAGSKLELRGRVSFPHSLGLFYLALTQYLGFHAYGDEYKVMGLAAHGRPRYANQLAKVVKIGADRRFTLDLSFFRHHRTGGSLDWADSDQAPRTGLVYTSALEQLLGPARRQDEPLEERHRDIAASVQAVYEDTLMRLLIECHRSDPNPNLCLAGGAAMNSLANGRITTRTKFEQLYVPSAPGDAGGALGAALWVHHGVRAQPRNGPILRADWGPSPVQKAVHAALDARSEDLAVEDARVRTFQEEKDLLSTVVDVLVRGGVVGWFQGRAEFGPRALGNRSILADPRRRDMRDRLNSRIKLRESFRPFAPSVLAEHAAEWFDLGRRRSEHDVPFMERVVRVQPNRRDEIPAVTHADGTSRIQTVPAGRRDLFRRLLEVFAARTGVPMLLNTSFNENEPIVLEPSEALDCFLRTRMDALVLGDKLILRPTALQADPDRAEGATAAQPRPRTAS
ncbi:MAG: carbamoyltransferase C-terminal domain-containing protein [Planctomycetota bacterium]